MKKIVYVTKMEKMPSNCVECIVVGCSLGEKQGWKNRGEILKKYQTSRPKDCPLIEIEE
jgi:hypothetical protein